MLRILKLSLGIGQVPRLSSDCSAEYIEKRTLEVLVLALELASTLGAR